MRAVPPPMTICFSRISSPKSAKSRGITKSTGSLSLFLYDSLYLYAQLLFLIVSAISAKLADFVGVKLSIFIVLCIQRDFQFYTIGLLNP
jgi:hypothetical protein